MKQFPEPVVGAFIFNGEGKLLLMKSHKWSDLHVVPGGHVEIGETIVEALKREVKEETNLDVVDPEFICFWEFIQGEEFHEKKHMIFLNHKVTAINSDIILNNEGQEYLWVSPKDALKLPLEHYTRMTIEEYLLSK